MYSEKLLSIEKEKEEMHKKCTFPLYFFDEMH